MSKAILDDIRRKHAKGELYTLSRNHCHELASYMVKTEEELRLMTMAADVEAREADKGRERVAKLEGKLHALESTVRTVRDKSTFLDIFGVPDIYLDDLYLLVPAAAEDAS